MPHLVCPEAWQLPDCISATPRNLLPKSGSVTNSVSQFVSSWGTLEQKGGALMVSQDGLRLLLRETVREMVAEELQTLLFWERE